MKKLHITHYTLHSTKQGFTIVELLVTLFIFSMFITSITSAALMVIKGQRRAFAIQDVQEAGRFLTESMVKEFRTSFVESVNGTHQLIEITNDKDKPVIYEFSNDRLYRKGQPISPSGVKVTGSFYVQKHSLPARAMITTVMKIESASSGKPEERAEVNLQSSVTLRSFLE